MRAASTGAGDAQADLEHVGRRVGVEAGPKELNGRPLPNVTSRARTMRRRFAGSVFAAAARVEPPQALMEGARVAVAFEVGPHLRPLPRRLEAIDHGPDIQARAADEERGRGREPQWPHDAVVPRLEVDDRELFGRGRRSR